MAHRHRRLVAVAALLTALGAGSIVATTASASPAGTSTGHRVMARTADASALQSKIKEIKDVGTLSSRRGASLASTQAAALAPENCFTFEENAFVATTRWAGADRYETSVCVSLGSWTNYDDPNADAPHAQAVVLARGDLFPDALAGGPLAANKHAPLLLTRPTSLPGIVLDEIHRVLAPGSGPIYLLGGTAAISDTIKTQLGNDGYTVTRVFGANRYATAVQIAKRLPISGDLPQFFFATGMNFPDALAAGDGAALYSYLASVFPGDVAAMGVLLTRDEVMPQVTQNYLINTYPDGVVPFTAGGQADAAAADFFNSPIPNDQRFVGVDRYQTATKIAGSDFFFTDEVTGELLGAGVGLTTGVNFPDALSATANLAQYAQPLLLTRPTVLSQATAGFLANHAGEHDPFYDIAYLDVFGGPVAVSDAVKNAATAAFTPTP